MKGLIYDLNIKTIVKKLTEHLWKVSFVTETECKKTTSKDKTTRNCFKNFLNRYILQNRLQRHDGISRMNLIRLDLGHD